MMMVFHFFKHRRNSIDVENVLKFFNQNSNFKTIMTSDLVQFQYNNQSINNRCTFYITQKSNVPNLYKLSPEYINLNFYLEVPVLISEFLLKDIMLCVEQLTSIFDLFIYHEEFSDITFYNYVLVHSVWSKIRNTVIKNDSFSCDVCSMKREVLGEITMYQKEYLNFKEFYQELEIDVNPYMFYKDKNNRVYLAFKWFNFNPTIMLPYVDYIIIDDGDKEIFMNYLDVYNQVKGSLSKINNYIKGISVLKPRQSERVKKGFRIRPKNKINLLKEITLADIIEC